MPSGAFLCNFPLLSLVADLLWCFCCAVPCCPSISSSGQTTGESGSRGPVHVSAQAYGASCDWVERKHPLPLPQLLVLMPRAAHLEKEVAGLREKIHHLDDMLKSQQRKVRQMIEQVSRASCPRKVTTSSPALTPVHAFAAHFPRELGLCSQSSYKTFTAADH